MRDKPGPVLRVITAGGAWKSKLSTDHDRACAQLRQLAPLVSSEAEWVVLPDGLLR